MKGVYNYIKEEADPITQQVIPRKYFSGGFAVGDFAMRSFEETREISKGDLPDESNLAQAVVDLGSMNRRGFLKSLGAAAVAKIISPNILGADIEKAGASASVQNVDPQVKDQVDKWITHLLNKGYGFNLDFKNVTAKHVEYLVEIIIAVR